MKHRLEFRAWIKDAEMCYEDSGMYYQGDQYLSSFLRRIYDQYVISHPSALAFDLEDRLMQYTGLKDKNGKKIFQGDIVTWSDGDYVSPSNPRIAEVRLDPELCFFAVNIGDGHKFGFSNFAYDDTENHLEVIGNIYETPELLNPQTND